MFTVSDFHQTYTSTLGGTTPYLSFEASNSEYRPADDVWSLGIILGELSGSLFQIQEGELTKYGRQNYESLVSKAKSVPALDKLIRQQDLNKDRIATILASRVLSIKSVETNCPNFLEIAKKTLSLALAERAKCSDILENLHKLKIEMVILILREELIFMNRKTKFGWMPPCAIQEKRL